MGEGVGLRVYRIRVEPRKGDDQKTTQRRREEGGRRNAGRGEEEGKGDGMGKGSTDTRNLRRRSYLLYHG